MRGLRKFSIYTAFVILGFVFAIFGVLHDADLVGISAVITAIGANLWHGASQLTREREAELGFYRQPLVSFGSKQPPPSVSTPLTLETGQPVVQNAKT